MCEMYEDFDIAYKAWRMNQIEQEPRKRCDNSFAQGNDNAIKLTDNEVDSIICRLQAGEKIIQIHEDTYKGICTIAAIRARVRKRGFEIRKIARQTIN